VIDMNKNTDKLIKRARKPNMTETNATRGIREALGITPIEKRTPLSLMHSATHQMNSIDVNPLIECNAQWFIDNNVSISNEMQDNEQETHIRNTMRVAARSWVVECKIKRFDDE